MVNKKKKAGIFIVLALLIAYMSGYLIYTNLYVKEDKSFERVDDVFYNPLIGFAVNADYPDAVKENKLVYVDITWREWEPKSGVYDINFVKEDNNWERWQEEGKNVVLRFVCDMPDEEVHMDIPDWLYEQTADGVFYETDYGKGYAPDYNNKLLIEAHRRAILKLGEVFGQDSFVAYVELGSLGHWGEWHMNYEQGTTRMPGENVRIQYVEPYLEAFPYAKFLARRPFAETAALNMGVFNDMTGEPDDTSEWLEWIAKGGSYRQPVIEECLAKQPDVWEYAPVGGEFTSSLDWDEMLNTELERTIKLLKESHTTFIGPKCPVMEELEQYNRGALEVLKTIGYRYGIRSAEIRYWKWSDKGEISLEIENNGVAPIYFPWKLYLYVYDEHGEQMQKIQMPANLMDIGGGENVEVVIKEVVIKEKYSYAVAIENPDTGVPSVVLDMECPSKDNCYILFEL